MKKNTGIAVWLMFFLFTPIASLAAYTSCGPGCYEASSCSEADVQSAVDAASDGDTIILPTCNSPSATWSNAITISGKGLSIRGQGVGNTVIKDATGSTYLESALKIELNGTSIVEISDMTFIAHDTNQQSPYGIIAFYGQGTNRFRVHHCTFTQLKDRGVYVRNGFGVIDNCIFEDTNVDTDVQGVSVLACQSGDTNCGDIAWTQNYNMGSEHAVYVENNTFSYNHEQDGALDAYGGARYVFRYNTVSNTAVGHHGLDSGPYRSPVWFEIYGNTFSGGGSKMANIRGGSGVIFNNTWSGTYSAPLHLTSYRTCCEDTLPRDPYCLQWGRCNGTNPLDGNQDASGYPCMDQVGRTANQVLIPVSEWNNSGTGVVFENNDCGASNPSCNDHIKEERDYFNADTCSDGIDNDGDGDKDMNDSACTAWWDAANGQLLNYSPYTYPHPLAGSNTGGSSGGGGSIGGQGSGDGGGGGGCFVDLVFIR